LQGNAAAVRTLLCHKASALAADYEGNNALMLACMNGHYDCADALTEPLAAADRVVAPSKDQGTVASAACSKRSIRRPRYPSEFGVEEVNREGIFPLAMAAAAGHSRLIDLLVRRGAKVS
jgi:ankyrin repeat protein